MTIHFKNRFAAFTLSFFLLIPVVTLAQSGTPENTAKACRDNKDNDEDGYVDCKDQDCGLFVFCAQQSTAEPATPPPVAPPEPDSQPSAPVPVPQEPAPTDFTSSEPVAAVDTEVREQNCSNRQDDDADGAIDCSDSDCAGTAACTQSDISTTDTPAQDMDLGVGVYGTLVMLNKWNYSWHDNAAEDAVEQGILPEDYVYSQTWDWNGGVAGGFGLFLEGDFTPFFSFGPELFFAFPTVEKIKIPDQDEFDCTTCKRDMLMTLLLRIKIPIKLWDYVAPYPIFGAGMSVYFAKRERVNDTDPDPNRNYIGVALTGGAGVQFYPLDWLIPFLDFKYMFTVGWNHVSEDNRDLDETLKFHTLLLNAGVRFL